MPMKKNADRFGRTDIIYRDVTEAPFRVHGLLRENGRFVRLPEAVARAANEGVAALFANTAGGRVRFATDSDYVAIHAEMSGIGERTASSVNDKEIERLEELIHNFPIHAVGTRGFAEAIVTRGGLDVKAFDPSIILLGLAGSCLIEAADEMVSLVVE